MANRIGGTISFSVNGTRYDAKGSFTYNLGTPKREAVVGADRVHGFTEKPQVPFIEGEITDRPDLDLRAFMAAQDATVSLDLANGKSIVLYEAFNASDGGGSSEEGAIPIRFEGLRAEEL